MLKDHVSSKVFQTHVSHQLFNSSLLSYTYYCPILQRRYLVTKCLLFKMSPEYVQVILFLNCFFSSNMFKWSFFKFFSLQDYTLVSNWDFLLLLTSKMTTLLVMNYCDLHAQDSYHVCPDAKQNSQWKCNKVY